MKLTEANIIAGTSYDSYAGDMKLAFAHTLRLVVTAGFVTFGDLMGRAEIDRHPELTSRAVAWTEFDGSYLVDTSNRGEMLDFFWTVLARPYPPVGWTGSLTPPVAGETSELWRVREYAQLNAIRALNYTQPMREAPEYLPMVQAGALVLAQNNRGLSHVIDPSWEGYNELAAQGTFTSELGGLPVHGYLPYGETEFGGGLADGFIYDVGNDAQVGHRTDLLHDATVLTTLGAAFAYNNGYGLWRPTKQFASAESSRFIAWPAPGFMPYAPFRVYGGANRFRWSFTVTDDYSDTACLTRANVSAKVNGTPVSIRNLVRNVGVSGLTWSFDPAEFDFATSPDGTSVEIVVSNVFGVPVGSPTVRTYRYTVIFFDPAKVTGAGYSPQTPLINISTRGIVGENEKQLIAGFSVSANPGIGERPVRIALRTQGPGLRRYGIERTAGATRIHLFDAHGNLIGTNAGWKQHQDWRLLQSFGLAPASDVEAAMVATLWPGNYTAIVTDDSGADALGLVEVFNVDGLSPTRLSNLSTRGYVGVGEDALIAGIVIKDTARTVVIRTQGPRLAHFGIQQPASDTKLTVTDASGQVVATNDDWGTDVRNYRLKTDLQSFAPTDPNDAALVLTLAPGAYTAAVTAKANPGIGIVEIFDP